MRGITLCMNVTYTYRTLRLLSRHFIQIALIVLPFIKREKNKTHRTREERPPPNGCTTRTPRIYDTTHDTRRWRPSGTLCICWYAIIANVYGGIIVCCGKRKMRIILLKCWPLLPISWQHARNPKIYFDRNILPVRATPSHTKSGSLAAPNAIVRRIHSTPLSESTHTYYNRQSASRCNAPMLAHR